MNFFSHMFLWLHSLPNYVRFAGVRPNSQAKYLSELDFSCKIKWKMSYQCRFCKHIAYGTISETYDLLLPVPQIHMSPLYSLA